MKRKVGSLVTPSSIPVCCRPHVDWREVLTFTVAKKMAACGFCENALPVSGKKGWER